MRASVGGALMIEYRTHDVDVDGGILHVASWRHPGPVRRALLATHGITSSHLAFALVAHRLRPGTLLLAPDLRGRGRSDALPGPYGMAAHVADCRRVLDELAGGQCAVAVGHSMGAFVAVALAAAAPEAVGELLLVDGGVPLPLPDGIDLDAATSLLGPAAERLTLEFPDRDAYREFWRAHPAFADDWSQAVVDYVDHDLQPAGPPWRSSCSPDAMNADFVEQFEGGPIDQAWGAVTVPTTFLRAPRGLQNEHGGLYPRSFLDQWLLAHPAVHVHEVDDVNHYTITLGSRGADAVASYLHDEWSGRR